MAPKLSEAIGQPVIVENKPSSSGNIGADFVAKAAGDGHTLLITDAGTLATQPNLVKKLSFDVQKDLVPVTMVMFSPYLFAVHPSVPAATLQELIAYDKANPGKLNVGTSGVGSIQHLTALVIAKKYGLKWGIVPYRGGAAAIRAVVAEREQRDLQRRARDPAVRGAEPAQGHRGVGRQETCRRSQACRPSRSSACRSWKPAPGRASSPAKARRPRWWRS